MFGIGSFNFGNGNEDSVTYITKWRSETQEEEEELLKIRQILKWNKRKLKSKTYWILDNKNLSDRYPSFQTTEERLKMQKREKKQLKNKSYMGMKITTGIDERVRNKGRHQRHKKDRHHL